MPSAKIWPESGMLTVNITIGFMGGAELLLAKVKNASSRIGIFLLFIGGVSLFSRSDQKYYGYFSVQQELCIERGGRVKLTFIRQF